MASIRKCPKCGLDLTDTSAQTCPKCGTKIVGPQGAKVWVGALVQIAISTAFMLAFGFPRIMIAIFGGLILLAAAFSGRMKARTFTPPPKPVSHPVRFRILSIGIGLGSIVLVSILLFGFVIFMNSWSRWHRYENASYHHRDFQVTRVYYQAGRKGGADVYASGTVDGDREWMNLGPYLNLVPRSQAELDSLVPVGTSISVYFFPSLKGRSRVQVFSDVPPAEASRREAMDALNYGLGGLALTAGIIFGMIRLRRVCFEKADEAFAAN
jgi:hypothetical protein